MSNLKLPYPPFLARILAWETESSGWWGVGSVRVSSIISSTILTWDLAFIWSIPPQPTPPISSSFLRLGSPHLTNNVLGPAKGPRTHVPAMPNSESCDHSKAASHCHANNSKVHLEKKCQSPCCRHPKLSQCFYWSLLSRLVLWRKQGPRGYGQLWLHILFPTTPQPSSVDWSWGRVKADMNKAHPAVCW